MSVMEEGAGKRGELCVSSRSHPSSFNGKAGKTGFHLSQLLRCIQEAALITY